MRTVYALKVRPDVLTLRITFVIFHVTFRAKDYDLVLIVCVARMDIPGRIMPYSIVFLSLWRDASEAHVRNAVSRQGIAAG